MLKNILVPTDFSVCATYAVDAAVQLARAFSATLHVLNIANVPADWHLKSLQEQETLPEARQAANNAEVLLRNLKAEHPDIVLETACRGGRLPDTIKEYVAQAGVELLVMGSHGASGKQEYFIGSQTQKVIRTIHRPVLVVKEPIPDLRFDKIVFASGFGAEEEEPFLRFKELVKHFVPEIHLVMIHTASLFEFSPARGREALEHFCRLCQPLTCIPHQIRDFNVEHGIRHFANGIGARLIVISNRNRHPIRRMLTGSNVEALVNHAHLPVLTIDY